MLQEADLVVWCDAVGEVTTIHAGTLYVDFYMENHSGDIKRECLEFDLNGRHKNSHGRPPLEKATSAQAHFYSQQEKRYLESSQEFRFSIAN